MFHFKNSTHKQRKLFPDFFFLVLKKNPPLLPGKFPLLWASVNPIQENPEIEEEKYNAETPHQLSL